MAKGNLANIENQLLKTKADTKILFDEDDVFFKKLDSKKPFSSLKDLILFSIERKKIGEYGGWRVPTSYTVSKKGNKRDQLIGASRSLHDLFIIARSYFPNTTLKQVYEILKELNLQTWYCGTFGKRMFCIGSGYKEDISKYYDENFTY